VNLNAHAGALELTKRIVLDFNLVWPSPAILGFDIHYAEFIIQKLLVVVIGFSFSPDGTKWNPGF
jgi:hypothetical protein